MSYAKRRRSGTRSRLVALIVGAVGLLALAGVNAMGDIVETGNLVIRFESSITPAKLPKRKLAPIKLTFSATIKTTDQTHVPVLKTITVEFNKHGVVDTAGVPTCTVGQLLNTVTSQAMQVCRKALVGTGHASAEIAFPEQKPFIGSGPLLIFNGQPRGGKPVLIMHVYAHVPAPTTFVTTGVITHHPGRFGTSIRVRIPTIVGGQGSLTFAEATIRRVLEANCPAPVALPGAVFPFARASFDFADKLHTTVTGILVRHCEIKKK